jgi:type I restriction enzyme S subunit
LERADAVRTKRRAALAKTDAVAQAVFVDMFGDPVSNPKGWETSALGDLMTFQQYGPRFYNEAYSPDGIHIVRITDLDEAGELNYTTMPRLDVSAGERDKYLLRSGDLLFARTGATVGKVAVIGHDSPPSIAGAYFITMRFSPEVDPGFVRSVLTSAAVRRIVAERSRQAAQQNFSGPSLRALTIPVPPHALQMRFGQTIKAVAAVSKTERASLGVLDALFASIQDRAFRGEL